MSLGRLTPEFAANVKPAHVGVYPTSKGFQHWNGRWWGYTSPNVQTAAKFKRYRSLHQNVRWRGLVQQPKVAT